nr:hypothetical protein [Tanacetum cinerariifolium]
MIDYSLWEVIENGNAPPIKQVVKGVKTIIAPTTAEEKNKPEIDTLSLDDLYNKLKIYELEVKETSILNTNAQNVAFVSSNSTNNTNGAVNTAHGATTASTQTTAAITPTILVDEVTLAQALTELKHTKPKAKAKGIVFHEPEESTTITTTIPNPKSQDKGKAKMIKEPMKLEIKDQIQLDEEVALKLQAKIQAEFDKEQKLTGARAQQEEEANIALIESWDDIQAKINADYQLAEILQAEEQQDLNDKEKATLFMQLLEKRRKFFAAKRAEEKRNKPPTQAQQRKIMCTYLKNMEGKKLIGFKEQVF